MNTIIVLKECGSDVSSRFRAAQLREDVIRIVEAAGQASLDFSGVRTISESFADELFAVLIYDRGEAWFRTHVKVIGLEPLTRATVLETIAQRLHESA